MRYSEQKNEEWQEEMKAAEKKKPEKERKLKAFEKDYDYYDLGERKPMLGGNPWS